MKKINISEIGNIIDNAPLNMNVLFISDTGIGKTTEINRYAKENGYYLKTLILSTIDPSEALGIPVQAKKKYNGNEYSILDIAIPQWVFELANQKKAILFLDEILQADPSVFSAFLNFLTEKKVHDIDLSHVKIVSATNFGEDNYAFTPAKNVLSRFCMFYVVNNTYNEYLKSKYDRILNINYQDDSILEGVLFEPRSLKPRCHEQLLQLKDENMLPLFFEGFTNTKYIIDNFPKFSEDETLQEVLESYVKKDDDGNYYLPKESYRVSAKMMIDSSKSGLTMTGLKKIRNVNLSVPDLLKEIESIVFKKGE